MMPANPVIEIAVISVAIREGVPMITSPTTPTTEIKAEY